MSAHLDPARFEDAEGPPRRAMLDHLASCPACRARAAAHDPTILFALLDRAPLPEALLDRVSSGVSARLDAARGTAGVRRLAAAAMAALTLLCGYATLREEVPVLGPAAVVAAHEPARAAVDVSPAAAVSGVVDFTVGDTQVVLVYNGDLHL